MHYACDERTGKHVFLVEDPRWEGFEGQLATGVTLEEDQALVAFEDRAARPVDFALGVHKTDPTRFRIFGSMQACTGAGYNFVAWNPLIYPRWSDYLSHYPRPRRDS